MSCTSKKYYNIANDAIYCFIFLSFLYLGPEYFSLVSFHPNIMLFFIALLCENATMFSTLRNSKIVFRVLVFDGWWWKCKKHLFLIAQCTSMYIGYTYKFCLYIWRRSLSDFKYKTYKIYYPFCFAFALLFYGFALLMTFFIHSMFLHRFQNLLFMNVFDFQLVWEFLIAIITQHSTNSNYPFSSTILYIYNSDLHAFIYYIQYLML